MTVVLRRVSLLDPPYRRNNLNDRTELLLSFQPAAEPALEPDSPRRGECAWLNRTFRVEEPHSVGRMYMPDGQPTFQFVCRVDSCEMSERAPGQVNSERAIRLFNTVLSGELSSVEVLRTNVACTRMIQDLTHICLTWRAQPNLSAYYDESLPPPTIATMQEVIADAPLRQLVCRGGGEMAVRLERISSYLRDRGDAFPEVGTGVEITFQRSPVAATDVPPVPGACAWTDGGLFGEERTLHYWTTNDDEPSFEITCSVDRCRLGWLDLPEANRPLFVERARPFITLFDWGRNEDVLFTLNCASVVGRGMICPSVVESRRAR